MSKSISEFHWRAKPADPDLRSMNNATKTHMAIARAVCTKGMGGVYPVRGIDNLRHGGQYTKAKA